MEGYSDFEMIWNHVARNRGKWGEDVSSNEVARCLLLNYILKGHKCQHNYTCTETFLSTEAKWHEMTLTYTGISAMLQSMVAA